MLLSIEDLTTARPHMHTSARFSTAEYRAYQEGYYWGVIYALRVALEAVERYRHATRTRRAERKQKTSA
jgi:hypothetical protein